MKRGGDAKPMTITLYLKPEQEELLRVIAQTSGVSVEGYVLTLIEAVIDPKPPPPVKAVLAAVQRLRSPALRANAARTQADDAIHQMRANVLAHQEKAVEAVTRTSLLRATADEQQRRIAQLELQSLTFLRDGEPEQALRAYQESCIYGRNLQHTRGLLEEAAQTADELLAMYRHEETKVKARLAAPHAAALAALKGTRAKSELTTAQVEQRIREEAGSEQWEQQFKTWIDAMMRVNAETA